MSVNGVTGARDHLMDGLGDFVARVRQEVKTPVAIGFGISTPQLARQAGLLADGVIAGSAVIQAATDSANPATAVGQFIRDMRSGMDRPN